METKKNISYVDFRDEFANIGCFSVNQIKIWNEKFDRNNLGRWEKQGKVIRLRQGYYTFPSAKEDADAPFYFANKLYAPSYVSLYSALSFYGMIPEGVVQLTSITSKKTAFFENPIGQFSYRSVKPELMFGYTIEKSNLHKQWSVLLAFPEKALLDLLYLNPHYKTAEDLKELRLDIDFMQEELQIDRLDEYLSIFKSKIMEQKVALLKGVYL
jgi:predicted transcriptional regulator of viral defense system